MLTSVPTSNLFTFSVPPTIDPMDDIIANEGNRVELTCSVTGTPKPTVEWYYLGSYYSDQTVMCFISLQFIWILCSVKLIMNTCTFTLLYPEINQQPPFFGKWAFFTLSPPPPKKKKKNFNPYSLIQNKIKNSLTWLVTGPFVLLSDLT